MMGEGGTRLVLNFFIGLDYVDYYEMGKFSVFIRLNFF